MYPFNIGNNQLKTIVEVNVTKAIEEIADELSIDHSIIIRHLEHIEAI